MMRCFPYKQSIYSEQAIWVGKGSSRRDGNFLEDYGNGPGLRSQELNWGTSNEMERKRKGWIISDVAEDEQIESAN